MVEEAFMQNNILTSFDLEKKVAVITGGGGELCGHLAISLGALGVKVAILDTNQKNAERIANKIEREGGQVLVKKCNVLDVLQLSNSYEDIIKKWGTVDLLIPGERDFDVALV